MSKYQRAYFLLSVRDVNQLPQDKGVEVAIVGRSNAGKSSVLNKITQQKNLARVSKTPGRTQMINVFMLDEQRRLMDLPGYGFAKTSDAQKIHWEKTIDHYLRTRDSLKGLILVMDIRHPLTPLDVLLLEFCESRDLPVHILLNKADKLSNNEIKQVTEQVKGHLKGFANPLTLQTFSVLKGVGLANLKTILDNWYNF